MRAGGFSLLLSCAIALPAAAQETVFATSNVAGAERSADEVRASVEAMVAEVGTVDVLVLQEVISEEQVRAAAEALDLAHWVISDLSPPPRITGSPFASLEVAVISRAPIASAAEWDTTGRAANGDNFVPRPSSDMIVTEELAVDVAFGPSVPSRGFLRVDLEDGPSVYAVHWKSSRGESCNAADVVFARQREDQASGVVFDAQPLIAAGHTVVIAGDFNIQAPGRVPRSGSSPTEDCTPVGSCDGVCGEGALDGYDDSIDALLQLDGTRLLSGELPATFVAGAFPGGAIDHVVVAGGEADRFGDATTPDAAGGDFAGSDHRPVLVIFGADRVAPDARVRRLLREIRERIEELEALAAE